MNRQAFKWHRLSGADAAKELHTNASCGLTRREARSRYRRGGANTLFASPRRGRLGGTLRRILSDPVWWLFVLVCLLALCFSEPALGLFTLLPVAAWLAFAVQYALTAAKQQERLRLSKAPTVRVLRDGRLVFVSASSVVRGDVILLHSGDIVPADGRLLAADHLRARFSYRQMGDKQPTVIEGEKRAETIYAYGEEIFAPYPENLLYGGSEILLGNARMVVTEIGAHTFLGAMNAEADREAEAPSTEPRLLSELFPYLRLLGLLALFLMLPAGIAGLFLSPSHFSAWRVFLPVCAFAATASMSVSRLLLELILYRGRRICDEGASRALLQTVRAEDRLDAITDLIVLGHAATSDGKQHFELAYNGSELLSPTSAEPSALTPLCEALLLLAQAEEALPRSEAAVWEGHQPYLSELAALCAYDLNALEVRLVRVSPLPAREGVRGLEVQLKEHFFRLYFYEDPMRSLNGCVGIEAPNGALRPMTPAVKAGLLSFAKQATARACGTLTVVRESGSRRTLVGSLAYGEAYLQNLPQVLDAFRQRGVRVRIFLDQTSLQEQAYAAACGCREPVALASSGAPLAELGREHTFFAGFSEKEILSYIQQLRGQGAKVAVIGTRAEDRGLLSAAALRVACVSRMPSKRLSGGFDAGEERGAAEGLGAVATVQRNADLLIPTATPSGGGLASFLRATEITSHSHVRVYALFKMLLTLSLFRTVLFLLSVFCRIGPIHPAYWLLISLVPDLLAVFLVSVAKVEPRATPIHRQDRPSAERILLDRSLWLIPTAGALTAMLLITVFRLTGLLTDLSAQALLLPSAALMQAVLLLFGRTVKELIPPRVSKVMLPFLIWLIPIAILILLSLLIPPIGKATELGAWTPSAIGLLIAAPLISLGSILLFSRFSE